MYILSDENVIFMDFFAVKVDGNDVNPGICKEVFIYTDSWVDVTLTTSLWWRHFVNFNSKKVDEDDIFVRQDILQFFSVESKDYKYLKSHKGDRHFKGNI